MATIAQLEAAKQLLLAQLAEIQRQRNEILLKLDDGSLTDEEGLADARENSRLRGAVLAKLDDIDGEIEKLAPSIPGESEYVRRDPVSGLYVYVNAATGQQFLRPTPPTAAQQASFAQRNPGADEYGNPLPPPAPEPAPPATAAETVQDDAPQGPTAPPAQTVGTDGRIVPPAETGTDAALKPTEITQAINTNSNSGQATTAPGTAVQSGAATLSPGAAADKDDAGSPAAPDAVNASDTAGPNIKPRPNVLDDYASYTYSASVYLMTDAQATRLLTSTTKNIDGYQLLFQSGGAPRNVGGIRPPSTDGKEAAPGGPDGGRNPYFDNDFYIDSVTVENIPPGKGTASAHTISSLKFTLVEPNGITLLDRLYDAVANSAPPGLDGKVNYTNATYLMVIRFYGYDSEGNREQVRSKPDQEGTSDPAAVIEKFLPFKMKGINWGVGSKLVSYEWDCVPVGQLIAGYASRGTIPYDVQLVDSTVGGLLGGDAAYSAAGAAAATPGASTTASALDANGRRTAESDPRVVGNSTAPAKANSAPTDKKTITRGLAGAMNEFQKKLVKDGVFTHADEYVIKFIGPDANKIRDAVLQLPNAKVDKRLTASGKNDPNSLDQAKTSVDMISRSFSITAGQQLLQAIELAIRNSSYIRDQALVIVNPDGTQIPNPNSRNKPLKWFGITMSAEAISELDPKRNDKAYRITYSISSREVKNVISKYFPVSRFTGVHKSYPYWFTGQNIAVLEYQETLNAMYQLTISGGTDGNNLANQLREKYTSSMADIVTYNYAPTSTESGSGAAGRSNEPGANAAEVLYSPGDLREAKVKIVGDPAWIMQGSNFRMPTDEYFSGQSLSTGFDPDGSISFDTQDVLFEIRWQRPEDYDLETGLADPYSQTQKKYNNRTALQSRVYLCKKVVSEFRHGAFTQTLEGSIYMFPIPDKSNTANPAAAAQLNTPGNNPNVTNEVAERAEVDLSNAAGQLARQNAAAVDPRLVGSVQSANQASAAVLGAQQNSASVLAPGVSTGGAGTATGLEIASTGISGSGASQPTPAGAAAPATDASGTVIATPGAVGTAPPKIAADLSPTSPTVPANQLIAIER